MPRPRTDIQPRILHAARARFLAESVDGASLRAIARDAGTSIGMIYYYYPTKDDLFLGVVEEIYAAVMTDLEAALESDGGFEARVRSLYRRIGHMTPIEADVFRLVAREALTSSERLTQMLARFQRGHVALLARVVAAGRAEGVVETRLPLPLSMITTLVLGVVPQMILRVVGARSFFLELAGDSGAGFVPPTDPQKVPPGDPLVEVLLGVLLRGIGAPASPP